MGSLDTAYATEVSGILGRSRRPSAETFAENHPLSGKLLIGLSSLLAPACIVHFTREQGRGQDIHVSPRCRLRRTRPKSLTRLLDTPRPVGPVWSKRALNPFSRHVGLTTPYHCIVSPSRRPVRHLGQMRTCAYALLCGRMIGEARSIDRALTSCAVEKR